MGSFDKIKPLSTVQRHANNNPQPHQEKKYWEPRELNLGLLCEQQVCYFCAVEPTSAPYFVLEEAA